MDVVANYAAGEELVGAFFSHENDKRKAPPDDDEGPSRGPKKNKKKKQKVRAEQARGPRRQFCRRDRT